MKKIKKPLLTLPFAFLLTSCWPFGSSSGSNQTHVIVNSNACKLEMDFYQGGYRLKGNLVNDGGKDISMVMMYVYFKDPFNNEYDIPAVENFSNVQKGQSYPFNIHYMADLISGWRFEFTY